MKLSRRKAGFLVAMNTELGKNANWFPLKREVIEPYKLKILDPLDLNKLRVDLLAGKDRKMLPIHTNGHYSLLVSYKEKAGAVMSFADVNNDITILQIQGAKAKGYRVSRGLDWIKLFADQIILIASCQDFSRRVTMPELSKIPGLYDDAEDIIRTFDSACAKYFRFIALAQLRFSQEEKKYIRDL